MFDTIDKRKAFPNMNFHVSISEKELIKINFVLFGKINIQTEIEPDFWYQFNGIQVAAFFFFLTLNGFFRT